MGSELEREEALTWYVQRPGAWLALGLLFAAMLLNGCGAGGYIGGGIQGFSQGSSITIDAGQSIPLAAKVTPGLNLTWTLSGAMCTSDTPCGSLSATTGATVTYTAPAALSSPIQVQVTAKVDGTNSASTINVTDNPAPAILGNPPSGVVGVAYSTTLTAQGGTAPLKWSQTGGSLPPGLTFNAQTGVISGTPTTTGTYSTTISVTDASAVPDTVTATETITVVTQSNGVVTINGAPGSGTTGKPYSAQLTASGGVPPYAWAVVSGALPTGLSINAATGLISGTPTTSGSFGFTVQAQDAAGTKATASYVITITAAGAPLTITTGTLPPGTVNTPYSATIGASGGTAPYMCAQTGGSLPAGLTLGANCVVSGTPTTAGTTSVTVKVTDSASPANSTSGPVSITINPAQTTLTLTPPPSGTAGQPYTGSIGVSGGTGPYTCSLAGGTLPAGLTLNANCSLSGTPTTPGSTTVTVKGTDSGNPPNTTTGPVTITINPGSGTLTLTPPPAGTQGQPYTGSIGVSGGTAPYTCTQTAGTLPAGLTLNANCSLSGTPTASGTTSVTVKATDSGNPQNTTTGSVPITINSNGVTLTITSPPAGTINQPYSGSVGVSGGTGPYTCALTGGTLETGLTLNSNCSISGTPTTSGAQTVTVKATDSASPANTTSGQVTVTINPATSTLTLTPPPDGTVGAPYTGSVGVSGGTGPYTCSLAGGAVPAGLTLNANCSLSGTPTTAGTTNATITAKDSSSPQNTTTGSVPITIDAPSKLTLTLNGSLPYAILNQPYSQTLEAQGGVPPYTYAITAGALPPGITMSTGGVISGTPTQVGAYSFTVTATDSESTPQTASLPLVLQVVYPQTANDGLLNGPYAFLFQGYDDVVSGVLAYQMGRIGSFTANGTGVLTSGEQDANHQTSTATTGHVVSTRQVLGTYTIGADDRGSMAITVMNADGTAGATTTYAIAVKAPAGGGSTATYGTMMEDDGNNSVGTRGTGTFLAQTAGDFAGGLDGSFAYGVQGDTPCLPACTVGVVAGPAASAGQFAVSGGTVSGEADATISSADVSTASLTGSAAAADANGRVALTMNMTGAPTGVYPADYAVYMVNANQAFVMSTDVHSAYILLAGQASKQSASGFTGASLNGPFVAYENAQTNPGLAGVALQNVLNLSTATIIRGTANGSGTCNTTNVDEGGTVGLVNGLSGLGNGSNVLNALLGTYQSTGNSNCFVSANGRVQFNYPQPSSTLAGVLSLLGLGDTPPPPRVLYLYGQNAGYYIETGYAGLGRMEQQTGAPFSLATLNGQYTWVSTPAVSAASTTTSGTFTADGAGHATYTYDENVGVGNVNLIELGQSGSQNYVLTDATAGRYVLGNSTVIYAITPSRFVAVDTSATTTSPSVAVIQ